ncbi:MAG: protein kinase domain-containing protein [Pyrinomonadaceae bacterium]
MNLEQEQPRGDCRTLSLSLRDRWAELCRSYLPVKPENSIWRYSRGFLPGDPEQGWKLHVPATVLTAGDVLRAVAPLLRGHGVLYKAAASLAELEKLNSGIHYGYSQVGKFITVYPRTDAEAALLAERLHGLTRGMKAPAVPFDMRYREGGCVYYRYGAFRAIEVEDGEGGRTYAIRDPAGNLVPDRRDCQTQPVWATDPLAEGRARRTRRARAETPLKTTYRAFRALAQRGRGGVYQALDLSVAPPRLCILKEGRRAGEVSLDGRDGFWRVRHEGRVLEALREKGVNVPRLYDSFKAEGNYYIVEEFIAGESIGEWLGRRRRRLAVAVALGCGAALARLVASIHAAGWVWRDCKPGNVCITTGGELRPLDFEGACPVDSPDTLPWGTPVFAPPEGEEEFRGQSRLPEDLYSLGAVVYFLLVGRPYEAASPVPLGEMRRGVPAHALKVISELLDPDPSQRPGACEAARRLEAARAYTTSARGRHADASEGRAAVRASG